MAWCKLSDRFAMSPSAPLARKWQTLRRQTWPALALVVPTWTLLGLARLSLVLVAQKRLAMFYGQDLGTTVWLPLTTPAQDARARHVRAALGIAARYSPWRADCYPQALTARLLLALFRVPHVMCFGLRRRAGAAHAHAWVRAGRVPVCGGEGFGRYTLVRAFVSGDGAAVRRGSP